MPVGSIAVALVISAIVMLVTGHNPLHAYRRLFEAAFTDPGALSNTLTAATPLCFTGLAAAVAFRVGLFNIGAEGQLYMGAIAAAGVPSRWPARAWSCRSPRWSWRAASPARPGR